MKTVSIELTEKDLQLIDKALIFAYTSKLSILDKHERRLMGDEEVENIKKLANTYFDVSIKIGKVLEKL